MSSPTNAELARALFEAEQTAIAIAPPSEAIPGLSIADAYEIQLEGRALREAAGERIVGHKVGLTSAAMQEMLGVTQPDFGYLTASMISSDNATLDASRLIAPRVEGEVAFKLSADLSGDTLSVEDVLAATEAIAPAIEIIDSRVADWRIAIADTIADNASSGHVVFGDWRSPDGLDPASVSMALTVTAADGASEIVEGTGAAVLGHPAEAIVWLARALHEYGGAPMTAGQVVIPGAMARALPVEPGGQATASMGALGEISVHFAPNDGG